MAATRLALRGRSLLAGRLQSDRITPGRLLGLGLVAGLFLSLFLLGQQAQLGRSPFGEPGEWSDAWVALVHCFGAGYLPAAYFASLVSGRRSLAELRTEVSGALESVDVAPLPPFGRLTWLWVAAGAAGAVLALLGPWLTEPGEGSPISFWRPASWAPEVFWHRLLGVWIGLWLGWLGLAGAARRAELDWCETAIVASREHIRHGAPAPAARSLADLVAYRELVAEVSSWPLDTPALRRMLLYLVIPLASWLASALVQVVAERVVTGP